MKATVATLLCVALAFAGPGYGSTAATKYSAARVHDDTFIPDYTLHLTYENVSIACEYRESMLINGSIPGPEIRLPPGKATWVRVYNDIPDKNTTIVS